jgi:intein/homing endonuclease
MKKELICLEDLSKNFKVVKMENNFVYLKLWRGRHVIRIQLPFEPNKELASLFGHILGDGCIKTKEENAYYTNKSKDLIEEFKAIVKKLFGIIVKENFNEVREFYEVYPPKTIAKLLVLCGFPKGEKVNQVINIPNWIKEGSNEIKVAFIRALFDDEATVINSKGNRMISFGMNKKKSLLEAHKDFVKDIQQILLSLGVRSNKIFTRKQPGDSIQVGFHIYRRYNLIKYLENIGFTDRKKREKLIRAINSYRGYGKGEIKMRIMEALEMKNKLRTKDLCSIVNRDRTAVWKNLNKLRKEGVIEKVVISKNGVIEKVFWQIKNKNLI